MEFKIMQNIITVIRSKLPFYKNVLTKCFQGVFGEGCRDKGSPGKNPDPTSSPCLFLPKAGNLENN
jgi:hypothetical protein